MAADPYLGPLHGRLVEGMAKQGASACLLVADEQMGAVPAGLAGLAGLTNRWDIHRRLVVAGLESHLSDFDFAPWSPGALGCVAYRVSKEKAVVHHVINEALERLKPGGTLWLAGHKQEGIKTYVDKAERRAGGITARTRLAGGGLLAGIERGETLADRLDDRQYREWRQLPEPAALLTKPGIFGWQQIDTGSALLVDCMAQVWPSPPQRLLDLGCGYGYLAVAAACCWPDTTIVATDNNVTAVIAARRNLERWGPRATGIVADCADQVSGSFDAVLCNPPFHQGFGVAGALTERFLAAAAARLDRGGRALFVVNAFIPLQQRARNLFKEAHVVATDRRFNVVLLTR